MAKSKLRKNLSALLCCIQDNAFLVTYEIKINVHNIKVFNSLVIILIIYYFLSLFNSILNMSNMMNEDFSYDYYPSVYCIA